MPAGYELSEGERDLMDHLHGIFAADDEDEIFGESDTADEAADIADPDDDAAPGEPDSDEPPLEADAVYEAEGDVALDA